MYATSVILEHFVTERVAKAATPEEKAEAKKLIIETNFFCPMCE